MLGGLQSVASVAMDKDSDIVQRMQDAIAAYEESAASLRRQLVGPRAEGITGYEEYGRLAEAYEERAERYRKVVGMLLASPATPS
mmetsp:Transcript_118238/g.252511  ORF Transcript_118238/g.252511 Transcript_118238/m.252511 type:complete len:85 (-) Transcript_118238:85-339(-)